MCMDAHPSEKEYNLNAVFGLPQIFTHKIAIEIVIAIAEHF